VGSKPILELSESALAVTLPPEFFERNTVEVARELLGTFLCRRLPDGSILQGRIVEVEAYTHDDPACHAFKGKTPRCEVMFGPGGFSYVYFIYGMYNCLNVVTEVDGLAGAVLIRAIAGEGTDGPGKLCRQWKIDRSHNGLNLMDSKSEIWLAKGESIPDEQVIVTRRIGLSVAQDQLWRFAAKDHPSVSGSRAARLASEPKAKKLRRSTTREANKKVPTRKVKRNAK
jgi:DNA-3-methyladenine glycosylase